LVLAISFKIETLRVIEKTNKVEIEQIPK